MALLAVDPCQLAKRAFREMATLRSCGARSKKVCRIACDNMRGGEKPFGVNLTLSAYQAGGCFAICPGWGLIEEEE